MSNPLLVTFLIDTSVWTRKGQPDVAQRLHDLAARDEVWTCRAVDLEVLYSERARRAARSTWQRRLLLEAPITPDVLERSLDVGVLMADAGHHRGAKSMDLIIAAAAEAAGLTVLHYDRDFDRIASVTGQPVEWVAPAGTLD